MVDTNPASRPQLYDEIADLQRQLQQAEFQNTGLASQLVALRAQLKEAQAKSQEHEDCPDLDMNGECPLVNEAISEKEQAQEERDAAKRAGIAASGKLLEAVLVGDQLAKDYDAATKRAEAAEALVEKLADELETARVALQALTPAAAQEEGG